MKALTTNFQNYDKQDFAESTVLYVLQHSQPSLKNKVGLKHYLKNKVIDLTPDEQPDLEKIIHSEIEHVTNQVSFKPDWFTTDDYLKLWKKYFAKFLDEHVEIQEFIQTLNSDFPNDIQDQFSLIIDSLSKLVTILKASYDQWHRKSMEEFFDSNLPLRLYNMYNLSYIEKISVMRSIISNLKRLQGRLYLVRANERKITRELSEFKRQNNTLSKTLSKISHSELVLRFYLRSSNAKELNDLFKTKPIKLQKNSKEQFEIYLNDFEQNLFELTNSIDKKHLDEDMSLNSIRSESFKDFDEKLCQIISRHV